MNESRKFGDIYKRLSVPDRECLLRRKKIRVKRGTIAYCGSAIEYVCCRPFLDANETSSYTSRQLYFTGE